MKKIDFTDMAVFEQFENDAIDGVLNYEDFPPEEYKYFSKLAKLGYNNRHKGWSVEICEAKQEEYRTNYSEEKAHSNRFVAMFRRINDNCIKATELKAKIYKAGSTSEITECALKVIELLTDEEGFAERIRKKINGFYT